MNMAFDDRTLAESIARQDPQGVAALLELFSSHFVPAHRELLRVVPDVGRDLPGLAPHFARAAGTGYLLSRDSTALTLEGYLGSLHLTDLMLVAACVLQDKAAWQHFQTIVDTRVARDLHRNFRGRVAADAVAAVVDDLAARCFEETSKGRNAGQQRLASYRGQATLSAWLYAVASKALVDVLRRRKGQQATPGNVADLAVAPATDHPEIGLQLREAEQRGTHLRRQLIQALQKKLEAMPARRRLAAILHWVHGERPSDIAGKMRVSRPRISELLTEARRQLREAADDLCRDIARESQRSPGQVHNLIEEELGTLLRAQAEER